MFQVRKMTFSKFPKMQMFLSTNVLAVSLSIDILARFSLSSVIVDLWNASISLNLLKLSSAVLRTAVIGKLSLQWPQIPFMGVRRNFFMGGNVEILLILFRLLTMQCKRTFTKRLLHFTSIATKMHFVGSNSQVYCDKLQNRLSADFSSSVLFYKKQIAMVFKTTIMSLLYLARFASIT